MTSDTEIRDLSSVDTAVEHHHDHGDEEETILELVGAEVRKQEKALSIPLLGSVRIKTRTVRYRQADEIDSWSSGKLPRGHWVVVDPRMTLKRALELFGNDLLYFQTRDHRMEVEFLILPVRQTREQSVRLLARKAAGKPGSG